MVTFTILNKKVAEIRKKEKLNITLKVESYIIKYFRFVFVFLKFIKPLFFFLFSEFNLLQYIMKEEKKTTFQYRLITCFSSFTTLHKDTNSISLPQENNWLLNLGGFSLTLIRLVCHKKEKKSFREKKCSCR